MVRRLIWTGKLEELLPPLPFETSSQNIITLWHGDILLTKLFAEAELTKFFGDVINQALERNDKQPDTFINSGPFAVKSVHVQASVLNFTNKLVC